MAKSKKLLTQFEDEDVDTVNWDDTPVSSEAADSSPISGKLSPTTSVVRTSSKTFTQTRLKLEAFQKIYELSNLTLEQSNIQLTISILNTNILNAINISESLLSPNHVLSMYTCILLSISQFLIIP